MFLHGGLLHIAFNMYALYLFGFAIESTFGTARFLTIYFVSGFMGSVASYVFTTPFLIGRTAAGVLVFGPLGVGASGAIFGLLGAWVAYSLRRRDTELGAANLRLALILIGVNIVFGFIPGIDMYAHLGGLAAGFACGLLMDGIRVKGYSRIVLQIAGVLTVVAIGVALTAARTASLASLLAVR